MKSYIFMDFSIIYLIQVCYNIVSSFDSISSLWSVPGFASRQDRGQTSISGLVVRRKNFVTARPIGSGEYAECRYFPYL